MVLTATCEFSDNFHHVTLPRFLPIFDPLEDGYIDSNHVGREMANSCTVTDYVGNLWRLDVCIVVRSRKTTY